MSVLNIPSLLTLRIESCSLALNIPLHLQYTRVPLYHERCKYRLPLVNIARLFFIDLVSSFRNDEDRLKFDEFFGQMLLPSHYAKVFVPKLLSRPADLSPGEYEIMAEMGFVYSITANPRAPDMKWAHLSTVSRHVLQAGRPQAKRV